VSRVYAPTVIVYVVASVVAHCAKTRNKGKAQNKTRFWEVNRRLMTKVFLCFNIMIK